MCVIQLYASLGADHESGFFLLQDAHVKEPSVVEIENEPGNLHGCHGNALLELKELIIITRSIDLTP